MARFAGRLRIRRSQTALAQASGRSLRTALVAMIAIVPYCLLKHNPEEPENAKSRA